MFGDIGWTELVLIGIVALIVIGPKDLPDMFRTLGRFTGKLRGMARDFQRAMDTAADEAGVRDIAKDLKTAANPASAGLSKLKDAATKFENWDPLKPEAAPAKTSAPASSAPVAAAAIPDPELPAELMAPTAAPTIHRKGIAAAAAEKQRAAKAEAAAQAEIPAKPAPKPRKPKVVADTAAEPAVKAPAKAPRKPRTPKTPEGEA